MEFLGHPLDAYRSLANPIGSTSTNDINPNTIRLEIKEIYYARSGYINGGKRHRYWTKNGRPLGPRDLLSKFKQEFPNEKGLLGNLDIPTSNIS